MDSIHVEVINLDRCVDRWEKIQQWNHGFVDFNRHSAFDASKDFDYLNSDKISLRTKLLIKGRVKRSYYDIDSVAAIGCSLSHYTILKNFYDNKALGDYLLTFEDDLNLDRFKEEKKTYAEELQEEFNLLPKDNSWDLWILGKHERVKGFAMGQDQVPWLEEKITKVEVSSALTNPLSFGIDKDNEYKDVRSFLGAQAIIYKRESIPKILDAFFPIDLHYDSFLAFLAQKGDIRIIHKPSFNITQSWEFTSTINHSVLNTSLINQGDVWYKIFFFVFLIIMLVYIIYYCIRYRAYPYFIAIICY